MKLKSCLAIIPLLFTILFVACDDDLNSVGGTVQPPSDNISVSLDTIGATAKTISMHDSVYARTINGVLGKYEDELFGTIKADYLAQFMYPDELSFKGELIEIDSMQFVIDFINYTGDTLAPMGLSVYEVNKPLVEDFYTNADPSKYCDLSLPIVNQGFTIAGTKVIGTSSAGTQRAIVTDLDKKLGYRLYDAYENKTITNSETFNDFFKGIYVTTNFGSTTMVNVLYTSIDLYYKYNDVKGNHDNTKDTIRTALFSLTVTPEVIQLNHIQNTNPDQLFVTGTGSTYLKTPAGVYTEIVLPLKDIREDMARLNMKTVNSAQFFINGNSQLENELTTLRERPNSLLLIDKDSLGTFFTDRQIKAGGIGSFTTSRNTSYNTYSFNNISKMINFYNEKGIDEITLLLVPVDISVDSSTGAALGVYNYLRPSTAILRSDPANMKLNLVYSRFDTSTNN